MTGLDFSQTQGASEAFVEAFNVLIDAAVKVDRDAQPVRTYLGASRLGEQCERALAYEWHNTLAGQRAEFTGRTYRIFQRGHDCEPRMASYLRLAGFQLLTEKQDGSGQQFGFAVAPDPVTGKSRISGHCDGVIVGWQAPEWLHSDVWTTITASLKFPCLWENKGVNDKNYKKYLKDGIREANPVYYGQCQLYMGYLGLETALFTAENQNTCEIYPEVVPFDLRAAQATSDKGVRVIGTSNPEELPRVARSRDDFRCKWCDHQDRCWAAPAAPTPGSLTLNAPWLSRG
jgi:hypothetical protein